MDLSITEFLINLEIIQNSLLVTRSNPKDMLQQLGRRLSLEEVVGHKKHHQSYQSQETPLQLWDSISVCCEYMLLPLVNKEAALTYGKTGDTQVGNPREIQGEERQSQRRCCELPPEKQDVMELRTALPGAGARDPATKLSALFVRDFPRVYLPDCRTHTSNTGYFNCPDCSRQERETPSSYLRSLLPLFSPPPMKLPTKFHMSHFFNDPFIIPQYVIQSP
ncbi:hypothetical protein STEG23_035083, partial [Scotinomys teguina]